MFPDVTETTVVLVRHGETDWNREGRLQGWAPVSLNDRGRKQVRKLGEKLTDSYEFDRVVASDLCRTRETTRLLREAGVEPEPTFARGWRERGLGVYQGFTRTQLEDKFPAFRLDSGADCLRHEPEGGERLLDACERVRENWEQLCADASGETTLVVTHGGPMTVLLAHLNDQDILTAITDHSIDNCALLEIAVGEESRVRREAQPV